MGQTPVIPVAVVGMACRLPGGITPGEALAALLRGDDLITEIPADRWDVDEYYDPEPGVPGRSVSRWGGFLDDVAGFDADFFGIGEREADRDGPPAPVVAGDRVGGGGARRSGTRRRCRLADRCFHGIAHGDYASGRDARRPGRALRDHRRLLQHGLGTHRLLPGRARPGDDRGHGLFVGAGGHSPGVRSLHDGESDLVIAGGAR